MVLQLLFLPLALSLYDLVTLVSFCLSWPCLRALALADFTKNLSLIFPQVFTPIKNPSWLLCPKKPHPSDSHSHLFLVLFPTAGTTLWFSPSCPVYVFVACFPPVEEKLHESTNLSGWVTALFLVLSAVPGTWQTGDICWINEWGHRNLANTCFSSS